MLRYRSDFRTLFFMFLSTTILFVLWNWSWQSNIVFVLLYSCLLLLTTSTAVTTHNHQHLSIWKNKWMNVLTDNWLTVFYGFPIFAWIPTHNTNHHKHINTEPDYTKTYRYSEKNNLLTLLSYPSISGYFQQKAVGDYLKKLKIKNKEKYYLAWLQIICLVTWVGTALIINWKNALLFVIIPQQVSMFIVLIFNYIQHVHADEEDPFNHSRNFTSFLFNFICLNNGYHTAHHIQTSLHWSELQEKHRELEPKINPALNESSVAWFLFRSYILGVFIPSMRTNSLRSARIQKINS